jgi:hypothetical protein
MMRGQHQAIGLGKAALRASSAQRGDTMSQLAQEHQWQLGSHGTDANGVAVSAVCVSCGLARVQVISTENDQHIDLRGVCPGTPQDPGEAEHGAWPEIGGLRDISL